MMLCTTATITWTSLGLPSKYDSNYNLIAVIECVLSSLYLYTYIYNRFPRWPLKARVGPELTAVVAGVSNCMFTVL